MTADAETPRQRSSVGSFLVHLVLAALVGLVAFWLVGAASLGAMGADMTGGVGRWVALAVALLVIGVAPIVVAAKFVSSIVSALRLSVIWSLALCLVLAGLMPTFTRAALHSHGGWPAALAGQDPEPMRSTASNLASWIPRADEPRPGPGPIVAPPTATPVAQPPAADGGAPSVAKGDTGTSGDAGASADTSAPEPTAGGKLTPAALFKRNAPSTIVIPVRSKTDKDDPQSRVLKQLGLKYAGGHGSGFFVSDDGLFVTNHHVLGQAEQAVVRLHDGRELSPVTVLVRDETNDLVLAKVDVTGVTPVTLAKDDAVMIGEVAVAIGAPRGLDFTLTRGIIGATRERGKTKMIQIDTTIAPGSSGGPLFADDGALIGVNTETRGAGLNMSVHVSHVRDLLKAQRTPDTLDAYKQGLRVASLDAEGVKLLPTTRANLEQFLALVAQLIDSCLDDHPPESASNQEITLRLSKRGLFGKPKVETSLGKPFAKCFSRTGLLPMVGLNLRSTLSGKLDEKSFVLVTFDGAPLPQAKPRPERLLRLRVVANDWKDPAQVDKPPAPGNNDAPDDGPGPAAKDQAPDAGPAAPDAG